MRKNLSFVFVCCFLFSSTSFADVDLKVQRNGSVRSYLSDSSVFTATDHTYFGVNTGLVIRRDFTVTHTSYTHITIGKTYELPNTGNDHSGSYSVGNASLPIKVVFSRIADDGTVEATETVTVRD